MEENLYSGMAVGGPMTGELIEGRFPNGILFVNKPTNQAWLYDYYVGLSKFYVRPVGYDLIWDGMTFDQKMEVTKETVLSGVDPTRELDKDKALIAAEGPNYEVRALPKEVR